MSNGERKMREKIGKSGSQNQAKRRDTQPKLVPHVTLHLMIMYFWFIRKTKRST